MPKHWVFWVDMLNRWKENSGWKEDKPSIIDVIQLHTVEFCRFFPAFTMKNAQPQVTVLWVVSSDLINRAGHRAFLIDLIITWACKKQKQTQKQQKTPPPKPNW